jgi:hypothetical protein
MPGEMNKNQKKIGWFFGVLSGLDTRSEKPAISQITAN